VQAALDAPRFCISPGLPESDTDASANDKRAGDVNSEVYFEEGIDPQAVATLKGESCRATLCGPTLKPTSLSPAMGHDARVVSGHHRGMMGRGQVIQKIKTQSGQLAWAAGSDPRADGHAAPQI